MQESQSHADGVQGADALPVTSPSSQSHEDEGEGGGTGSFPSVVASGKSDVVIQPAENEREPSTPSMKDGDSAPISGDLQEPEQNHANGLVGDDDDPSDDSSDSVRELTHTFKSLDFRTKEQYFNQFDKDITMKAKDQQERDENRWMPSKRQK